MGRVLIVDRDPQENSILAESLARDQHAVSHASGLEEARLAIRNREFDCILVDQGMTGADVAGTLAAARETDPRVAIVLLTTPSTLSTAIENLHEGAVDLLTKPFTQEIARTTVLRACGNTHLLRENDVLKAELDRLKRSGKTVRAAHDSGNGNHSTFDLSWIENLPPSFDLRGLLASLEKSLIERTLQSTHGAQAEAARRLGLSRSDLSYKLLKYELRKETTAAS